MTFLRTVTTAEHFGREDQNSELFYLSQELIDNCKNLVI